MAVWFFSGGTITKSQDREKYHAHHAVLWTHQEFSGDIKVSFETKSVDEPIYGNILFYIQAQGIGNGPYKKDIHEWRKTREVPAMNKYFQYMDLLSISFRKELRLKRYPLRSEDGTEQYAPRIGEFSDWHGVIKDKWLRYEIEKRKKSFTIRSYDADTGELMADVTWDTSEQGVGRGLPFVEHGRIGIRHMSTKQSVYRNFKRRKIVTSLASR